MEQYTIYFQALQTLVVPYSWQPRRLYKEHIQSLKGSKEQPERGKRFVLVCEPLFCVRSNLGDWGGSGREFIFLSFDSSYPFPFSFYLQNSVYITFEFLVSNKKNPVLEETKSSQKGFHLWGISWLSRGTSLSKMGNGVRRHPFSPALGPTQATGSHFSNLL